MRARPPDAVEMERARNTIETGIVGSLESIGGVADRLNAYNHHTGTPDYLQKDVERYRAVTAAAVQAFARDHLMPTARVVVHAVPGTPEPLAQVATPPAPKPGQGKLPKRLIPTNRGVRSRPLRDRACGCPADPDCGDAAKWPAADPE